MKQERFCIMKEYGNLYVITNYEGNHTEQRKNHLPIDSRIINSKHNIFYYLIDKKVPYLLKDKNVLLEAEISPEYAMVGKKFLAEWSFLLSELDNKFCQYPFFVISSRFFDKNRWLDNQIENYWTSIFHFLDDYGFGFMPSYDRPFRWLDFSKTLRKKTKFNPFLPPLYDLVNSCFGVSIPNDYRYCPDLFCNYIGFSTREDLIDYVNFYSPLINHFFDKEWKLKRDFNTYVNFTGNYVNEKPITYIFELLSHLFFFEKRKKIFCMHYDGFYEVDSYNRKEKRLVDFKVGSKTRIKRYLHWKRRQFVSETYLGQILT